MVAQWYADGFHCKCIEIGGSEIEYISAPNEEFCESAHFDLCKHRTPYESTVVYRQTKMALSASHVPNSVMVASSQMFLSVVPSWSGFEDRVF